jgi:hypothetical protein
MPRNFKQEYANYEAHPQLKRNVRHVTKPEECLSAKALTEQG